jgi:acetyl-CoA synthetase
MIKKGDYFYPSEDSKKKSVISEKKTYLSAQKDPISFWSDLAKELIWQKKYKKNFVHNPPYFNWFVGGKINITENCLENNINNNKNRAAIIWQPENIDESKKILTYHELYVKVNRLANTLKEMGVKKGDRVAIYLPMIPEAVISMLACARIGAVHSVVFSAFSSSSLSVRLKDTGAKLLITADGYYRRGDIVDLKKSADESLKDTKIKKVIVVKRTGKKVSWVNDRDFWWNDVISKNKYCKPELMDSEDPLFILYTSGSTGKPKGVIHTCGGYTVQAKFTGKWIFNLKKEDIFWCTADIGWVTGHTYTVYSPLLNGATTLIFEGAPDWPIPDRWCEIIEDNGVTAFYTAPTAIRMFQLINPKIISNYSFNTLKILGSVGEPIDEKSWLWFFKNIGKKRCPIVDTWWQTETGGVLLSSLPGIGPFKPTFTGLPFPGINFKILNEKGKECKVNEHGNLVILPPFSPGLFRGIYKDHKKYLDTYWKNYGDRVYFTSDTAYKDKKGLIRVVGRSDDVIKVAGHRLSTAEMENAISKIDYISEVAVIGVKDNIKGEVPIAFIVTKNKKEIKNKIAEVLRKEIGPIAIIKEVYIVSDLPKTRSGKIMRRVLKGILSKEKLGDLSTLSNPESVDKIKKLIK